jgi:hypothetical protein
MVVLARCGRTGSSGFCVLAADSILQRKVLEPNDYENLDALARTLNQFERHWNAVAEPLEWSFTRDDLAELMDRLAAHEPGCDSRHDRRAGAQPGRWDTTLTSVPLGSRSMKRRTPHSSSRRR